MLNNISIVKFDRNDVNTEGVYDANKYSNFKNLLKDIKTEYVIFVENINNINLTRLYNTFQKYTFTEDIIISMDKMDIFKKKININELDKKYLSYLIFNLQGLIIKSSKLKDIDINIKNFNRNIKECTEIVNTNPSIRLINDVVFNTKLTDNITYESILDFKYLNSNNNFIYLYKLLDILVENMCKWGVETAEKVFSSIKKEICTIDFDEFLDFIKIVTEKEDKIRLSLYANLVKDNGIEEVRYFSQELLQKNNALSELKNKEIDIEKVETIFKDGRLKTSIIWDKFITNCRKILVAVQYYITLPFLGYKDIWLIGERTDQAEDNAYILFKYIRENDPKKNIFYIIDKSSTQKEKVDQLGNVIYIGSFKHKVYLMHAKKLISAYDFFNFLLPKDAVRFKKYYFKYMNSSRIFLQHGVALNKANYYNRQINKYDYVLVSTVKEYNMFRYEYGYSDEQIIKIGLPRYDNLVNTTTSEKKILLMPTWRNTLVDLSEEDFMKTDYYKAINNLINNNEFIKNITNNNIKLIVYLHYEMQKFNSCFKSNSHIVSIRNRENSIVQELLKECDLLITDFSSVGVDFSYLDKPVIFYQFSSYNFHYDMSREEEYTLYSDFGQVLFKEDEVIKSINYWINNKFQNIYPISNNLFYNRGEGDNCKKIYSFIKHIPEKQIKNYHIDIVKDNILKEKRLYDRNYEFVYREYFSKDGRITSKLFYKDGFINRQEVYEENGKCAKVVYFYKNIKLKTEFLDIYDDYGNLIVKHIVGKNGELNEKEILYPSSQNIRFKRKYSLETGKMILSEEYYENQTLKSKTIYNEEGKAIKHFYYNEDGTKRREYNYYESGKVKEKMFFIDGYDIYVKKLIISEINQNIIEEIYLNKRNNTYETKKYFVL